MTRTDKILIAFLAAFMAIPVAFIAGLWVIWAFHRPPPATAAQRADTEMCAVYRRWVEFAVNRVIEPQERSPGMERICQ